MKASMFIAALTVAVAGLSAPSAASAQQCYNSTTCPAGTACINGVCQQNVPVPPGYGGSGSVTVQGGGQGVGVQVQAQPQPQPVPQPVYAQPVQQPVYAQPMRQPQPRTESRPIIGLIVSGAILLGVSWVTNIIVSAAAGTIETTTTSDQWSDFRYIGLIPVVGPWIQMAVKPTAFDQDDWAYYLTVNGILQAAGLTMLVLGIAIPVERTVYAENGERRGIDLAIAPSTNGISLLGRF